MGLTDRLDGWRSVTRQVSTVSPRLRGREGVVLAPQAGTAFRFCPSGLRFCLPGRVARESRQR